MVAKKKTKKASKTVRKSAKKAVKQAPKKKKVKTGGRKTVGQKASKKVAAKKTRPTTAKKSPKKEAKTGPGPKVGKLVFLFGGKKAEGAGNMKDLLGGKGAGLAEMTNIGIPVPPGFTITTDVCTLFYENNMEVPKELEAQMKTGLDYVEKLTGMKFGNASNPLLLSVRSGAKFSMPGMMDTVLNLGLNDDTIAGLIKKTENERFVYDSYRRFIQMFGNVVLGIDKPEFEEIIAARK